jgi:hypothetical protein
MYTYVHIDSEREESGETRVIDALEDKTTREGRQNVKDTVTPTRMHWEILQPTAIKISRETEELGI